MKLKLTILLICLLISKLNYSQDTLPRIILIGNDTLIAISPKQVKKINLTYNYKGFLEDENKVLSRTLGEYTLLSHKKDSLFQLKVESEKELREQTSKMNTEIDDLSNQNSELDTQNQKLKKGRKKWLIGGAIGGILLTLFING